MRVLIFLSLIVSISLSEIKYVGSSTIGGTVLPKIAKDFSIQNSIKFDDITVPGSGKGIKALLSDKTKLAGISRNIKDKERAKELRFFIIAYDAIGVIVNRDNPIKNLSKEQLKKVFSGEIKNWSELGGKDMPIVTVTEILGEKRATQIVFTKIIFKTKKLLGTYNGNNVEVDKPIDIANYVAQNERAIGATSMVFFKNNNNVHSVAVNNIEPSESNIADGSYPISRPLKLVTKKDIDSEHMKFIDYIYSPNVQNYINQTFVAVKANR